MMAEYQIPNLLYLISLRLRANWLNIQDLRYSIFRVNMVAAANPLLKTKILE